MIVNRISSSLAVGGKVLDRAFTFDIFRVLNTLSNLAVVRIEKDYSQANKLSLVKGDALTVRMTVNNGGSTALFTGLIRSVIEKKGSYVIEARDGVDLDDDFIQAYQDTSASTILHAIGSVDIRHSGLSSLFLPRFIATGTKKEAFESLIKTASALLGETLYYWMENGKIVVTGTLGEESYNVDDYAEQVDRGTLSLFPLPALTIGDTLTYLGTSHVVRMLKQTERQTFAGVL